MTADGPSFASAAGREAKALKIEAVLATHLATPIEGRAMLDVGCGSGHIAAHFAAKNQVTGVDAVDQTAAAAAARFTFVLTTDETLPFPDGSFDIALSNHVAAYLPSLERHFAELYRVLRPGGVAYVATPNRFFPLEPHTRKPFIHWLPRHAYRAALRRITGRDERVRIPSLLGLRHSAERAGFGVRDYTMDIVRDPARFHFEGPARPWVPRAAALISPTVVLVLTR